MKHLLITSLVTVATIVFSVFVYNNWKNSDRVILNINNTQDHSEFVYSIDNRFINTVTKEIINQAISVIEIIPSRETQNETISSYHNIQVSTFTEHRKDWIKARNKDEILNVNQVQILQSLDYGSSFSITGNIRKIDDSGNSHIVDTLIYYVTVVPSQPAHYKNGNDSLINYLRENSQEEIMIAQKAQLQPGKINFTVSKEGAVKNIKLASTSGYNSIDQKMLELIDSIPGEWQVATNARGEKVGQSLTFFFGIIGC